MKIFTWMGALLLGAMLTACGSDENTGGNATNTNAASSFEQGIFPNMSLRTLDGAEIQTAEVFADKVVVFNVWATWCPPCRHEMPDLVRLSALLPKDKYVVVGLAADNDVEDVKAYVAEHGISFPVYWDEGGKLAAKMLKVHRYPETFLVDNQGRIASKVVGAVPWADPENVSFIENLYSTAAVDMPETSKP